MYTTADFVDDHLEKMKGVQVDDEADARLALTHAMAAVGGINQGLVPVQPAAEMFGGPISDILDKLQAWIDRLFDKLTEIAKTLNASFSTVGTNVSVTLSCGPFGP